MSHWVMPQSIRIDPNISVYILIKTARVLWILTTINCFIFEIKRVIISFILMLYPIINEKMKEQIMYIEHKTNQNDNGSAWIGKVEFSKSGQTIYFNNQAFKKLKAGGINSNYYDLVTGEEYWISGVKKNGQDRHRVGSGKVKIDIEIIDEYLTLVDFETISESKFEFVDIPKTDKTIIEKIENLSLMSAVKRKSKKNMKSEE